MKKGAWFAKAVAIVNADNFNITKIFLHKSGINNIYRFL